MNPFRIDGKLAMITGGSRGIGYGAAEALAISGANILLVGRHEADLDMCATKLRTYTSKVEILPFDLMHTESIAGWIDHVFSTHGTPDILVNSAGVQRRGPAVDLTLEDWNSVMTLNATAIFELSRCFARHRIALG